MGLFSFLSKNKQDRTAEDSGHFYRAADDAAPGERARAKRASGAGEGSRRGKTAGDPMLPEKKRARRRLVGAIALALAAAVGLPMLLDSEPKPLAGDIAIQIPAKDKAGPLPMPAEPGAAPVAAADTVDKGEEIIAAPKQGAAAAAAQPKPVQVQAQARPVQSPAVAEVRAQSRPEPASAQAAPRPDLARAEHVKPEPKQEPKPEAPKPEHKAPPKTESRPEPRPEPKLAAEKPKPARAEDKPAHPLAADESSRALAILEGKQAEQAREAREARDAAGDKVVLQVAALGSAEKAAELQARLREAGIHSFTQKVTRPSGDLIRVKVGPYSRDEAEKVRARLGKLGLSGTINPA
jgi:DedD protein